MLDFLDRNRLVAVDDVGKFCHFSIKDAWHARLEDVLLFPLEIVLAFLGDDGEESLHSRAGEVAQDL